MGDSAKDVPRLGRNNFNYLALVIGGTGGQQVADAALAPRGATGRVAGLHMLCAYFAGARLSTRTQLPRSRQGPTVASTRP